MQEDENISKSVTVLKQSGRLKRKPQGEASGHESKLYWQVGERAEE